MLEAGASHQPWHSLRSVAPSTAPRHAKDIHTSGPRLWRDSWCPAHLDVLSQPSKATRYNVVQHPPRNPSSTYLSLSRHYTVSRTNQLICCTSIPGGCSSSARVLRQTGDCQSATFCSSPGPRPAPPSIQLQPNKQPSTLLHSVAVTGWSGIRLLRTQQSLGNAVPTSRSIHASSLQADSVLRKRRTKMKRHKWKKRSRLMRRKSKVSQGAKR